MMEGADPGERLLGKLLGSVEHLGKCISEIKEAMVRWEKELKEAVGRLEQKSAESRARLHERMDTLTQEISDLKLSISQDHKALGEMKETVDDIDRMKQRAIGAFIGIASVGGVVGASINSLFEKVIKGG